MWVANVTPAGTSTRIYQDSDIKAAVTIQRFARRKVEARLGNQQPTAQLDSPTLQQHLRNLETARPDNLAVEGAQNDHVINIEVNNPQGADRRVQMDRTRHALAYGMRTAAESLDQFSFVAGSTCLLAVLAVATMVILGADSSKLDGQTATDENMPAEMKTDSAQNESNSEKIWLYFLPVIAASVGLRLLGILIFNLSERVRPDGPLVRPPRPLPDPQGNRRDFQEGENSNI